MLLIIQKRDYYFFIITYLKAQNILSSYLKHVRFHYNELQRAFLKIFPLQKVQRRTQRGNPNNASLKVTCKP